MYEQLSKMMHKMLEQDFNQAPRMVFMGRLRAALIDEGFSVETAENIVTRMKVDISEGALNDEQMTESIDIYSKLIVKISNAYLAHEFEDVDSALINSASELSFSIQI